MVIRFIERPEHTAEHEFYKRLHRRVSEADEVTPGSDEYRVTADIGALYIAKGIAELVSL
jgi:hypothetical protein